MEPCRGHSPQSCFNVSSLPLLLLPFLLLCALLLTVRPSHLQDEAIQRWLPVQTEVTRFLVTKAIMVQLNPIEAPTLSGHLTVDGQSRPVGRDRDVRTSRGDVHVQLRGT